MTVQRCGTSLQEGQHEGARRIRDPVSETRRNTHTTRVNKPRDMGRLGREECLSLKTIHNILICRGVEHPAVYRRGNDCYFSTRQKDRLSCAILLQHGQLTEKQPLHVQSQAHAPGSNIYMHVIAGVRSYWVTWTCIRGLGSFTAYWSPLERWFNRGLICLGTVVWILNTGMV